MNTFSLPAGRPHSFHLDKMTLCSLKIDMKTAFKPGVDENKTTNRTVGDAWCSSLFL